MSNTGDRRYKEEMVIKKRVKLAEIRKEEEKAEHKLEGNKYNHKKH